MWYFALFHKKSSYDITSAGSPVYLGWGAPIEFFQKKFGEKSISPSLRLTPPYVFEGPRGRTSENFFQGTSNETSGSEV